MFRRAYNDGFEHQTWTNDCTWTASIGCRTAVEERSQ